MKRTKQMGDFTPSTLIDYLAGRPLEIEPIWGEPLRRAESLGVAAPRLEKLYHQLVSLDRASAEMKTSPSPKISVHNRQRKIPLNREELERFASRALRLCLDERGRGSSLTSLEEIQVLLISDRRMSELHRRFMGISGPTDVITFHHGEIFISAETARRQARTHRTSLIHELRLYLVHGLLHLHGFDDHSPAGRRMMGSVQEKIVARAARVGG